MNKIILFSLLLLLAWADAFANEPDWQDYSAEVFDRARAENRLVMVDLAADWCAFCKKMDATTWRDPDVLKAIDERYIPVRIQDELHPKLAEEFRHYGRPATVIFDPEGTEIISKRGYIKPQWMFWMLQAIAQENN